ncbi:long-chain specific acyl-CoA dehydrogenase, mitochondrial-like [Tigriopus californicus]|uniref:long-chain specific acyl-CoA dehydrogenase, mitochondrial-like n=1 Tax=Tigriopus californicus TaxID=6832 RepID=UPI0027DA7F35|nr:long-chain specific acyl-CoA dehydrogenase, mitochondrial-like [Tigriopus californicus]
MAMQIIRSSWARCARPCLSSGVAGPSASRVMSSHHGEGDEAQPPVRPPPCQMDNLMDIGSRSIFNEDHDMFRESARRFMRDELAPLQMEFEDKGQPSKEIWAKLGQQGLLGTSIKAEVGGIGGSFKDEAIVLEEQAYAHCASPAITVHSTIVIPYFQNYGTPEQQEKYIPDLVAGRRVAAIGMTEPDAGSDLQGIRTNAKADGDDFILNGSKVFITNGIVADVHVIVAVTDPNAKSKAHGITLFAVEDGMPGFKKGKNLKKMGLKGQDTAELFLEDVRVPKSNIVGGLNRGFYQLMNELPQERLGIAITSIAACEWMFEATRDYLINRKAFGRTVSDLQTVQHRLAEMKTATAVCRSFIDECIQLHDSKSLSNETASMAKYWATDLENTVAAECVQLHGGWGYMWETPIARSYANARVQTIYGGTNEIMKELIARSIVKR